MLCIQRLGTSAPLSCPLFLCDDIACRAEGQWTTQHGDLTSQAITFAQNVASLVGGNPVADLDSFTKHLTDFQHCLDGSYPPHVPAAPGCSCCSGSSRVQRLGSGAAQERHSTQQQAPRHPQL